MFVNTKEELSLAFNKETFDELKFPGGTSKRGEHFSAVIVPKMVDKKAYFLIVPYDSTWNRRHPDSANGHTKRNNETPEQTAQRELMEETGLFVEEADLVKIDQFTPPTQYNPEFTHVRYCFLAKKYNNEPGRYGGGSNPIDGETGEAFFLGASICKEVLSWKHKGLLDKALENLMMDREWAMALL